MYIFLFESNVSSTFILLIMTLLASNVTSSLDDQCCRKRIECFECDSRFNPGCNDAFNQTRENGNFVYCNDLCVKLRHKYENTFYYIRSCADQFKNVLIKKTEVCYSTRKKDGSYLCFCGHDRCNQAVGGRIVARKSLLLVLAFEFLFLTCFYLNLTYFFHI